MLPRGTAEQESLITTETNNMENTHFNAELGRQQSYDSTEKDYQVFTDEPAVDKLSTTNNNNKDSHWRSLIKGVTYRIISTLATVIVTYVVLGDVSVAFEIGFVDFFVKLMIYYLHERAWSFVTFL